MAARALDLTLTSRSKDAGGAGIPMCGVPFHAVDGYLAKLVGKGFRVAICEQVEDPEESQGLVKREVVRVVSPGTLTDANYLEAREPAYLMAIVTYVGGFRGADPPARRGLRRRAHRPLHRRVHDRRYRGAEGCRRWPTTSRCCGRARSSCPAESTGRRRDCPEIARLQLPVTTRRALGLRSRKRRAGRCSISSRRTASRASASTAAPPPSRPPAASLDAPARHAEGRPRARAHRHASRPPPTASSSIRSR